MWCSFAQFLSGCLFVAEAPSVSGGGIFGRAVPRTFRSFKGCRLSLNFKANFCAVINSIYIWWFNKFVYIRVYIRGACVCVSLSVSWFKSCFPVNLNNIDGYSWNSCFRNHAEIYHTLID